MGILNFLAKKEPLRPTVRDGVTRICVCGFDFSPNVGRAVILATKIAEAFPDKYETWFYITTLKHYAFVKKMQTEDGWLPDPPKEQWPEPPDGCSANRDGVQKHTSAPFVWLEYPDKTKRYVGGRDYFCVWASKQEEFANIKEIRELALKKGKKSAAEEEDNPFTAVKLGDSLFDRRSGLGKERKMDGY